MSEPTAVLFVPTRVASRHLTAPRASGELDERPPALDAAAAW